MDKTLHYIFDPLCGWCYGASAALAAVADSAAVHLNLLPSGLFAEEGARKMDDDFAAYAWSNDQRIERLTGQRFTERYRAEVLGNRQQRFDSALATLALSAVALTAPDKELDALKAMQQARYVDGKDITRTDTLVSILETLGLAQAALRLQTPDAELLDTNRARMDQAQRLLQAFGARGVPTFILETEGQRKLLHAGSAFADPQAFAQELQTA